MSEWVPVGTLLSFVIGGGWGDESPSAETLPCTVIRGADIPAAQGGDISRAPLRYETPKKLKTRTLQAGDLILEVSGGSRDQPTGRTVWMSESLVASSPVPVIPASFCRLVRPDHSTVDSRYLYYWLQQMYADGRTWGYQNQSTGIANFQMPVFERVEMVRLPPLAEQERIAGVLGAFDDLIEVNRRLMTSAAALQREYFLDATRHSLRVPLSSVMTVEMGQSPPGDTYNEAGVGMPFYQGVKDFGTRFPSRRVYCTAPRRVAHAQDLLLAVRAPIGSINVATEECATGRGLAILRSTRPATALQAMTAEPDLWRMYQDEGTVFASINREVISRQLIRWSSENQVESTLSLLDELVLDCSQQVTDLTRQRDELLPLLMSGKVVVGAEGVPVP